MLWRPFRERSYIPGPGARLKTGHALVNGLQALWAFNEQGGFTTFNALRDEPNGALTNMATSAWTGGQWGPALDFAGAGSNDNISVGVLNTAPLFLTICCWTFVRTYQNFSTWFSSNSKTELRQNALTGQLEFQHNFGVGGASAIDPIAMPRGQWCHIAGTWDGAIVACWINGTRRAAVVDASAGTMAGFVTLGGRAGSFTLDGFMQDMRVYNRGLTANELVEIVENPADIWEDTSLRIFDLAVPPPIVPPNIERLCDNDCCGIFFGPGVA